MPVRFRFPSRSNTRPSQRKLHPKFLWIFLIGELLVLLVGLGLIQHDGQVQLLALRQAAEQSEKEEALILLQEMRPAILEHNWASVQSAFLQLDRLLPDHDMLLLSPSGEILVSSQASDLNKETTSFDSSRLSSQDIQTEWLSLDGRLQIFLPVTTPSGQIDSILLYTRSPKQELYQLASLQRGQITRFLLLNVLFSSLGLAGLFWFYQQPLEQLTKLAQAAGSGSKTVRAPEAQAQEVQRLSLALNRVFDRMLNQRSAIEKLTLLIQSLHDAQAQALESHEAEFLQHQKQLENLRTIIATTSSTLDLPILLHSTLDQMMEIVSVPKGTIWVNQISASRGLPDEAGPRFVQAFNEHQIDIQQNLTVNDWQTPQSPSIAALAPILLPCEIRSSITLPIFSRGEIVGHVSLGDSLPREWQPEESALLEIIAYLIGVTADREQALDDIQSHNERMRLLVAQSELLNQTFTPHEVIAAVGQGAQVLCRSVQAAVFSRTAEGGYECAWSQNLTPHLIETFLAQPQLVNCYASQLFTEPILISDIRLLPEGHPTRQTIEAEGIAAFGIWPVTYQGQANALVCCLYPQPNHWGRNELEPMEAFCRQAAAAIENARLLEAEHAQRRLSEALREVAATLNSTLNLNEVLEGVLQNLNRVVAHDAANIMMVENDTVRIARFLGYHQEHHDLLRQWKHPIQGLNNLAQMIETKQAVVIPDVQSNPHWIRFKFDETIRSYAGVPICHQETVLGFININSSQPNFFRQEIGPILQTFANQVAIAVTNARLYQNTQERAAETSALYRAMQPLFNPSEDIVALAHQITESVTQEFASAHCSLLLLNEAHTHLGLVAQSGYIQPGTTKLALDGPGLTVQAVKRRQVVYAADVHLEAEYVMGAAETCSELVIPLQAGDHLLGVLNLESPEPDAFDEHAQQVFLSFAERAALSLDNARLFHAIRQHVEQMIRLNDITHVTLQNSNLNDMLQKLTRKVAQLFKADGCYITLWNETQKVTVPYTAFGPAQEVFSSLRPDPGEMTLTESTLREGQTLLVEDVRSSPYISSSFAARYPVQSILALPLIANEQKMGAALVGFIEPHHFTPDEVALGEQAAGQIALAMAKLRSLELAQRRAQEAETLRRASMDLTSSLELQQVLDSILNHLEQVVPYDSACVFLIEPDHLHVAAVKNIQEMETLKSQKFSREDTLFREIETSLKPVILADAQQDPRFHRWGGADFVRGWMGVPLIAGKDLVGVLTLDRSQPHAYTAEEILLAQTFANHGAIAVQNARLYQSSQQRAVELEALHTATTTLVSTLDLQMLLEKIQTAALTAIPAASAASLHLMEPDTGQLRMRVSHGLPEPGALVERILGEQGHWSMVLKAGKPLLIGSTPAEEPAETAPEQPNEGQVSAIIAPLLQEDVPIGTLSLVSTQPEAFTEADLRLLVSFASTATAAIQNAQLHRAVRQLAITDPLTGVYNRRGFHELAQQAFIKAKETRHPLAALMIDIDFLSSLTIAMDMILEIGFCKF